MSRLGVFGGSFNPVHLGHLHIATLAREAETLDEVLFVPAAHPPHKDRTDLAAPEDRLAMLEIALEEEPNFAICDIELQSDGPRYTVETLEALARTHPGSSLTFIMGLDSLVDLPQWRDPGRILTQYTVVAVDRPGLDPDCVDGDLARQVHIVTGNPLAVSSTQIRSRIARGKSVRHLVPPGVHTYLVEHDLYRKR